MIESDYEKMIQAHQKDIKVTTYIFITPKNCWYYLL